MSTTLTKYVAASALAGAIAFGGFTIAGAQDGTTTTTPPTTEQGTTTAPGEQGQATPPTGERPDGARPDGAGCDHDKGAAGGTSSETAPGTGGATTTDSSASTST